MRWSSLWHRSSIGAWPTRFACWKPSCRLVDLAFAARCFALCSLLWMASGLLRALLPRKIGKGQCAPPLNNKSLGSKSYGLMFFCAAAGKTSQPFVRRPSIEGAKVSSIARNAPPWGKYEART